MRMFHHCVVQGMLLILTCRHHLLSTFEQPEKHQKTLLQKIIRVVFKQGFTFGGLQLCSQTILSDFLREYERAEDISTYVYKDKQTII